MKGFAKIALIVALVSIVTLSVVVASVAWFTDNPDVGAGTISLNAARTLTVAFDTAVEGTNYKYNGQIGNVGTGADAPYVYQAGGFKIQVDSLSSDSSRAQIKVGFGTVDVSTPSSGHIFDVLISDLFTITADIYVADDAGSFVKVYVPKASESDPTKSYFRSYEGAEDDELDRYSKAVANLTIADDGTVKDGDSTALFTEGTYELSFTYTFLPEAAYAVWEAASVPADYASIYGYECVTGVGGDYIGVVTYTAYKEKYHQGLQRYVKSNTQVDGAYTYTPNDEGDYVRVVTSYQSYADVTKYDSDHNVAAAGQYIKVGDSNDYIAYSRYNRINGFPYSNDKYRGETFTFSVACAIEEV